MVPHRSNTICSHHFFQVKTYREEGKLKLKCRLVLHGNRDVENHLQRTDSSTAQLIVIRLLLLLAALLYFHLASLGISGAYLQSYDLERDIYMRPLWGWTDFIHEIWEIVNLAYGLVDSGRLGQLSVEEWLTNYGFKTTPGLPKLFILWREEKISILVSKVVDDFLLAGDKESIASFHRPIANRFQVGRFIHNRTFEFNRKLIRQAKDFSAILSTDELMDKIYPIALTRYRRKQHEHLCTKVEVKQLQELAE